MIVVSLGDPYSINIEGIDKLMSLYSSVDFPIVLVGSMNQWKNSLEIKIYLGKFRLLSE